MFCKYFIVFSVLLNQTVLNKISNKSTKSTMSSKWFLTSLFTLQHPFSQVGCKMLSSFFSVAIFSLRPRLSCSFLPPFLPFSLPPSLPSFYPPSLFLPPSFFSLLSFLSSVSFKPLPSPSSFQWIHSLCLLVSSCPFRQVCLIQVLLFFQRIYINYHRFSHLLQVPPSEPANSLASPLNQLCHCSFASQSKLPLPATLLFFFSSCLSDLVRLAGVNEIC